MRQKLFPAWDDLETGQIINVQTLPSKFPHHPFIRENEEKNVFLEIAALNMQQR